MSANVSTPEPHFLNNLLAPASGRTHAVKFNITVNGGTASLNWPDLQQSVGAWIPQAMRIDNLASANSVLVSETSTGWSELVQAGFVRTVQFPAVKDPIFTVAGVGGAATVVLWLYDWPAFPDSSFNPATAAGQFSVSIIGQPITVIIQGTMPPPAPVSYIQASGGFTITVGGTSQACFAPGEIVTQGVITNPFSATESLWVTAVGNAVIGGGAPGTTEELIPGQSITFGPAAGAINVNATTAGHAFVAYSS